MSDTPECLQPAVEQLQRYETQISALESRNKNLDSEIESLLQEQSRLNEKIVEKEEAHKLSLEAFDKEKITLRELNSVVRDQLREKSQELEALEESNKKLTELNSRVSSESIRVNAGQEALSHQSQRMSEELETLRRENDTLKEENASLKLVNETEIKPLEDLPEGEEGVSLLMAEISRLKKELLVNKKQSDSKDQSFLESENERLMQRHGEITQEKMQASAKMHAAIKELEEVQQKLDTALSTIERLESELQNLQDQYANLMEEKESLIEDNLVLIDEKSDLDGRVLRLSDEVQRVKMERDSVQQALTQEHIVEGSLTDEVNHLRAKSRRLAEEIKALRGGHSVDANEESAPLEIEAMNTQEGSSEMSAFSSENSGPHFPGEGENENKY